MIRRATSTQRSSSSRNSMLPYSASPRKHIEKKKGRKVTPLQILFFATISVIVGVGFISMLLTPSQQHDLVEAERKVEGWAQEKEHKVEEWVHQELRHVENKNNPKLQTKNEEAPLEPPPPPEDILEREEHNWEEQYIHPDDAKAKAEHAKANANLHSSKWVDGEKELKKKLRVLFDQQSKGKNLAAPVLTRYLGEDIPAYVGTPDSTMQVEEWNKLVEKKYEEMRKEEEDWQAKMALFIEQEDRNMGITTA